MSDSERKFEYTFLCRDKAIAVCYFHSNTEITNDRLQAIEECSNGLRVIYVTDESLSNTNGQYPDALMRIQKKQGYCLLLKHYESDYFASEIRAVFYEKGTVGLWQRIDIARGKLSEFSIADDGNIVYDTVSLSCLSKRKRDEYNKILYKEKEYTFNNNQLNKQQGNLSQDEKQEFIARYQRGEFSDDKQIIDEKGNRWVKCEYCGKFDIVDEFVRYGGPGKINIGQCKECAKLQPNVMPIVSFSKEKPKFRNNLNVCPICGSRLKEKRGKFGTFMGCEKYPECRYTCVKKI